jgi:hypothetical protein
MTGWMFSRVVVRPDAEVVVVLERQADQVRDRVLRLLGGVAVALRSRCRWECQDRTEAQSAN